MPVGYLSDPELARLNAWPDEIAAEDAVTFFTLSGDDLAWLTRFNRVENRLGVAVQLSTLPRLGWIPDDLAACPAAALERLATAHAIDSNTAVELLRAYGGWQGETRRKHRAQVLDRLGWRLCAAGERKLLDEFLLARALEHDAPGVLLQLACDRLRAERIVRPSVRGFADPPGRYRAGRGAGRDLSAARAAAPATATAPVGRHARRRSGPGSDGAGVAAPRRYRGHAGGAQG